MFDFRQHIRDQVMGEEEIQHRGTDAGQTIWYS